MVGVEHIQTVLSNASVWPKHAHARGLFLVGHREGGDVSIGGHPRYVRCFEGVQTFHGTEVAHPGLQDNVPHLQVPGPRSVRRCFHAADARKGGLVFDGGDVQVPPRFVGEDADSVPAGPVKHVLSADVAGVDDGDRCLARLIVHDVNIDDVLLNDHTEHRPYRFHFGEITGEMRPRSTHSLRIFEQCFRRGVFRINGDGNKRHVFSLLLGELIFHSGQQHGQNRAHIGASREDERHNHDALCVGLKRERVPVLVDQREVGHRSPRQKTAVVGRCSPGQHER